MARVTAPQVTNTNAETKYLTFGEIKGDNGDFALQFVTTKGSGTLAGTVTPQMSLDGTNFIAIPGTSDFTLVDQATNSQIWFIVDRKAPYYRMAVTTTGTNTSTSLGYYIGEETR